MAVEHGSQTLKQHRRSLLLGSLMLVALSISKTITDAGLLSRPVASLLAWSLIGLVSYWIVPEPKVNYLRWILVIESVIIGWHLAFFVMPELRPEWCPLYVVMGLSFFFCLLSLYFVMQVLRLKNPLKLTMWAVMSVIWSVPISLIYFYIRAN